MENMKNVCIILDYFLMMIHDDKDQVRKKLIKKI